MTIFTPLILESNYIKATVYSVLSIWSIHLICRKTTRDYFKLGILVNVVSYQILFYQPSARPGVFQKLPFYHFNAEESHFKIF